MMKVFGRDYELYVSRPRKNYDTLVEQIAGNIALGEEVQRFDEEEGNEFSTWLATDVNITGREIAERAVARARGDHIHTIPVEHYKITPPIHMEAELGATEATTEGSGTKGVIKVFNLSREAINYFQEGYPILLRVRYKTQSDFSDVFLGTIVKVYTQQAGSGDVVTTVVCSEEAVVKAQSTARAVFKLPYGSTYMDVFDEFIREFDEEGIPLGAFYTEGAGYVYKPQRSLSGDRAFEESRRVNTGQTASDGRPTVFADYGTIQSERVLFLDDVMEGAFRVNMPLSKAMSAFCASIGFVWMISLGKLYIMPDIVERPVEVVEINPDMVIGGIEPSSETTKQSDQDNDAPSGIKLKVFFTPDIRAEHYIRISYGEHAGTYKPSKLKYTMQWHEGDWTIDVEAIPVSSYEFTPNQSV